MAHTQELRDRIAHWLDHYAPDDESERSAWAFEGLRLAAEGCDHVHASSLTPLDREEIRRVFALAMRLILSRRYSM